MVPTFDQVFISEDDGFPVDAKNARKFAAARQIGAGHEPAAFDIPYHRLDDLFVDRSGQGGIDPFAQADLPGTPHWTLKKGNIGACL